MLNLGSQPVCRAVQLCVKFSALDEEDMVLKLVSITIYLNIFVAHAKFSFKYSVFHHHMCLMLLPSPPIVFKLLKCLSH